MTTPKIVPWIIAHEPAHLFIRTAKAFAAEIEETSKGKLLIDILTVEEYVNKYNDEKMKAAFDQDKDAIYTPIFDALEDGRVAMSQTVVSAFGVINKDFLHLIYRSYLRTTIM